MSVLAQHGQEASIATVIKHRVQIWGCHSLLNGAGSPSGLRSSGTTMPRMSWHPHSERLRCQRYSEYSPIFTLSWVTTIIFVSEVEKLVLSHRRRQLRPPEDHLGSEWDQPSCVPAWMVHTDLAIHSRSGAAVR